MKDPVNLSDENVSRSVRTWSAPDDFGNQTLSDITAPRTE